MLQLFLLLAFTALGSAALAAAPQVDPAIPPYQPLAVAPPAGARYIMPDGAVRILAGNHGMKTILEKFDALFEQTHPGTVFHLDFDRLGNAINIPSVAYGVTLVGPMGRAAMPAEMLPFRQAVGGEPLVIRIAHGTVVSRDKAAPLGFYVNMANPLERLTIAQAERIFTAGAPGGDITHWGQLGLGKEWDQLAIHAYGTPEISGFGAYLLQEKMHGGLFRLGYESFPLAAQIVNRVGEDVGGIGFAALGFLTPDVKLLAVADEADGAFSSGSAEDVMAGRYPLDRYVYFYIRDPADLFVRDYVSLVLSREGQQIIADESDGFLPLNAREAAEERTRLAAPWPIPAAPFAKDAGSLAIVGDDAMKPVVAALDALFRRDRPEARFTLVLKGSSTGISGLTAGVSSLAPMAREHWPIEIEPFKRLKGYAPTDIHIGRLRQSHPPGLYVNSANPLTGLRPDELAGLLTGDLTRWRQLGLAGKWAERSIHLYGPPDDGGFVSTIRASLLQDRPFGPHFEAVRDPLSAVAADPFGVALAESFAANRLPNGTKQLYALDQFIRFYIDKPPGQAIDPRMEAYLRYALSPAGQAAIGALSSFSPLDPGEIAAELSKLSSR